MNFLGPQLEKWLLTGQALYKNTSLGLGAVMGLDVPIGKSIIITKIEILPYINCLTDDEYYANMDVFMSPTTLRDLSTLMERTLYSFKVYNKRVFSSWNFRPVLKLDSSLVYDGEGLEGQTAPGLVLDKQEINCFIIAEEPIFFQATFPDFRDTLVSLTTVADFNADYLQYNSLPPQPLVMNNCESINDLTNSFPPGSFKYKPFLNQNTMGAQPDQPNAGILFPSLDSADAPSKNTTVIPPHPPGTTNLRPREIYSLPIINVEYLEINKRTTTEGI